MRPISHNEATMDKTFLPDENYLMLHWRDLESAWRMLATPSKQTQIDDALQMVRKLDKTVGPEKAAFTLVAATAWLTDEDPVSESVFRA